LVEPSDDGGTNCKVIKEGEGRTQVETISQSKQKGVIGEMRR